MRHAVELEENDQRLSQVASSALGRSMRMLRDLKARFPRLFPVLTAAVVLSALGGAALYERSARDCCQPGAACCHPGAACCKGHQAQAQAKL
jgi:hypothetical protein